MAVAQHLFLINYWKNGEETTMEIPAYSEEQAIFLSAIEPEDIIDIECVVKKYATG